MNRFVRNQIDVVNGEAHDWDLLNVNSLYKEEFRKNTGKEEMIGSYLNASKNLYCVLTNYNHPDNGLTVIWRNPLCVPFLFLCRHTLELSIKYYLERKDISFGSTHDIKNLYEKTSLNIPEYYELVEAFTILDKTGTMLRYSVDNSDREFRKKPLFVNSHKIIIYVEKLCTELLNLGSK